MEPTVIFFFLALIFSIIIHEVSHGFAAEALGDPTARLQGRLTLNPLPHIDPIGSVLVPAALTLWSITAPGSQLLFGWAKPVPFNPYNLRNKRWGEALVAGAGPAANVLIALIFGLVVRFGIGTLSPAFVSLAAIVVYINVLLALFNLIPIPPLDGSKLLKSVLPFRASLSYQRFELFIQQAGFIGMLLLLYLIITLIGPAFHAFVGMVFSLVTGVPMSGLL